MMRLAVALFVVIASWWWFFVRDEGGWDFETHVVRGGGVARKIDWRTANLPTCPPHATRAGFYSCRTNYGDATMLRRHPQGDDCEVHIHDFNDDIYGQPIKLKNIKRLDTLPFVFVPI